MDISINNKERQHTYNAERAINELPKHGYAPNATCYKRQRKYGYAGDHAKLNYP